MNIAELVAKWRKISLTERSASQQHFLDLCEVLEHPTPAAADPTGQWFTFERGAEKHSGGKGWADVWKKGFFAWEYKGKHKNLAAAYDQLLQYREALENPPLMVVCDMDRIIIRTNFTGTATQTHELRLEDLNTPRSVEVLRAVFHAPERLKPGTTSEAITTEAAQRVAEIAQSLRDRGLNANAVARFLDRMVFCLFAEDIGLLPLALFTRIAEKTQGDPRRFAKLVEQLFDAMAHGGDFGLEVIRRFNGNLFIEAEVLELQPSEIESLYQAARLDWSAVDPSIFGTLFERGMDPAKRAQLGAHYTSREDIETLIEPVVLRPLRREWEEVRNRAEKLLESGKKKAASEATGLVMSFYQKLATLRVLDPACGSGNFLYVTLQKLKDLEKEVIVYTSDRGIGALLPLVGPWQLCGIETNPYAFELAQMVVWIGYLQWTRANGFGQVGDPVLRPTEGRRRRFERSSRPERTGVARGRLHRRKPSISGREAASQRAGRRLCRCSVPGLRRKSATRVRPGGVLVRKST